MERVEPRACLALLWGCLLAAAAAAQGKEGECARGAAPARCSPGGPTPAPRDSRSPAGRRAQLWKPTWRRQPCRAGVGRARARAAFATNLGPPAPELGGLRGPRGGGWARGARRPSGTGGGAGHAVAVPLSASGTRPDGGAGVPWRTGCLGAFRELSVSVTCLP